MRLPCPTCIYNCAFSPIQALTRCTKGIKRSKRTESRFLSTSLGEFLLVFTRPGGGHAKKWFYIRQAFHHHCLLMKMHFELQNSIWSPLGAKQSSTLIYTDTFCPYLCLLVVICWMILGGRALKDPLLHIICRKAIMARLRTSIIWVTGICRHYHFFLISRQKCQKDRFLTRSRSQNDKLGLEVTKKICSRGPGPTF